MVFFVIGALNFGFLWASSFIFALHLGLYWVFYLV